MITQLASRPHGNWRWAGVNESILVISSSARMDACIIQCHDGQERTSCASKYFTTSNPLPQAPCKAVAAVTTPAASLRKAPSAAAAAAAWPLDPARTRSLVVVMHGEGSRWRCKSVFKGPLCSSTATWISLGKPAQVSCCCMSHAHLVHLCLPLSLSNFVQLLDADNL